MDALQVVCLRSRHVRNTVAAHDHFPDGADTGDTPSRQVDSKSADQGVW